MRRLTSRSNKRMNVSPNIHMMIFYTIFKYFNFQHLEQEKHRLRLQLESMEDEYAQRVSDLKADADDLRAKLREVRDAARERDIEKKGLVGEEENIHTYFTVRHRVNSVHVQCGNKALVFDQ